MEAIGAALILTRRHLTFEQSAAQPGVGQETSFEVSLTEATAADDLTAVTADRQGNLTPARVTKVETGRWTVTATFSTAGDAYIQATTTGTRLRRASTTISVVAGDVSFGSGFDEQAVDSDRDGLIDQLVLTPTITIPSAGEYQAQAKLLDASGVEVTTNAQGASNLVAGSQPLRLEFDGKYIYKSGRWGPYTLEVTVVRSLPLPTVIDIADARLGQTAAYDYMQFQPDRPLESPGPSGTPWPTSSSALPKLAAWRGSEILRLASGYQADVVGVQPGGSIVVLEYTNTGSGFRGALFAIRPDGKPKPGWPAAGVPVPVGYGNQVMARDGTVYVSATETATTSDAATSIDITAVSPDGKVVSGWPYKSPAALHDYRSGQLVLGPSGQVCFLDYLPNPAAQGATGPSGLYCLGADGKTLPGWPYTSNRPMDHPAFGADGTIFVEQYVEQKPGFQEIVALGPSGKPAPGWTPWTVPTLMVSPIVVAPDGRVYLAAMGMSGNELVVLAADGTLLRKTRFAFPLDQDFHQMATAADGSLFVSTMDSGDLGLFGKTASHVSAFSPDGSVKPGWPAAVDGPTSIFLSPDGSVWTTWQIWGNGQVTDQAMAVFEPDGKLRTGYPIETPDLGNDVLNGTGLVFDSSGNAYAIMYVRSGYSVAKIPKR